MADLKAAPQETTAQAAQDMRAIARRAMMELERRIQQALLDLEITTLTVNMANSSSNEAGLLTRSKLALVQDAEIPAELYDGCGIRLRMGPTDITLRNAQHGEGTTPELPAGRYRILLFVLPLPPTEETSR